MFGVESVNAFSSLVVLDYISPFNICRKAGFVVLNSLNFCLSEKFFISPSILNEILAGYNNLGCRFFPFSALHISCHSLLALEFLLKDHLLSTWSFPCMLLVCYLLLLPCCFNILSLFLVFVSLICMCLGVFLLGFILYGTLYASWI